MWNDISDSDKKAILLLAMSQAEVKLIETRKKLRKLEHEGKTVAWNFEPEYYRDATNKEHYLLNIIETMRVNLVEVEDNIEKSKPTKEEKIKQLEKMIASLKEEQNSPLPQDIKITMYQGKVQNINKKNNEYEMEISLLERRIDQIKKSGGK
ncbi:hypothetical protein CKN63_12310 [Carnobacterium divergens]|uniref:hypothetical protein n=1 Tax=Carnobacterium divergens TaxID=2748 RepID=UPI001072A8E1|nr:hypothetical protein [Carnobacterium divergens]TFI60492.1 hypothetical protein CKN59_13470 [Carnobacterium divergens]TFI61563.1 hypothetical protein CKN76_12915 [Carnobacterium divergens]TFJ01412.1 hypothetical protein CKN75_12325 [Carnobacterium divergens]TFJ08408.1 hypothetical protein CKN71_13445 [Carnobacterium divergens]TFJ16295.1 hypothetical protein CKN63_12310 [Carnobacterium divergens]